MRTQTRLIVCPIPGNYDPFRRGIYLVQTDLASNRHSYAVNLEMKVAEENQAIDPFITMRSDEVDDFC